MRIRLATLWVAALALMLAVPAAADVGDYLGKTVASIRMESDGRLLSGRAPLSEQHYAANRGARGGL